MHPNLIYDVGVHTGTDTAYYLHKGFRVIAIEANPTMAGLVRDRFADAIADGRLTLLNVGIADQAGELEFFVCDDMTEWSSFNRDIAGRDGARHHAVRVATRTFDSILDEHGVPRYCKIDIEGFDRLCVEALSEHDPIPEYVSIEMDHGTGDDDIALLSDVGYRQFKIVSQTARTQPIPQLASLHARLPSAASKAVRLLEREVRGTAREPGWRFARGSSGPFGEDTPGPWRLPEQVTELWRHLHRIDANRRPGGGRDWFDIHAKRDA